MQTSGSLKSSLSYASQLSGTNLVSSFTLRNIRWLLLTFKPRPPKHCSSAITVGGGWVMASAGSQFWEPSLVAQWVKNLPMQETQESQL